MASEKPKAVSREGVGRQADTRGQSIQDRLQIESEEVDKSALIRTWQDGTAKQPLVSSGGIISRLFDSCTRLLRQILEFSKKEGQFRGGYIQLRDALLALNIWSEDHNLPEGDLDTQLHNCEELQELICTLLLSLADLLVNGLLQRIVSNHAQRHGILLKYDTLDLIDEARKSTSNVESPVDYTRDSIPDIAATLATLVDCLVSLNPSLEQLAKHGHDEQSTHDTMIADRPPYLYHMELVRSKFPDASQSLLERLGKCNWERYVRLQEQRETFKEDENVQAEGFESKSKFYDSGLGTSVPTQSGFGGGASIYAETLISSRAASSHQKLPKLPEKGRKGERFTCEVCSRVVAIRWSRDWKKHIFQDLLAYSCIYEECVGLSLWEDRHMMTNHLAVEHGLGPEWKSHVCPLCRHHTGEGRELISLHIARHMEEIALNALPSAYESDSELEDDTTATDMTPSTSTQDYGSRYPTHHPIWTTAHSSGDPVPDDQHDIMFPVTRAANNFSPEPNSFGDRAHEYLDRRTNVSTNPVSQDSSNNTFMDQVKTGQAPGRYDPEGNIYPLLNSVDQNPPCNTLYVGNLPIDTSEDELKAVFSKQRGYKRLYFRTTATGSMCFVEFEDISSATKALNELYGHLLHNSVKGGIRLSFPKNPLGVRSGQSSGSNIAPTLETPRNTVPGVERGLPPWSPVAEKDFREPELPDQGPDISTNPLFKDSPNDIHRNRTQERQVPDIEDQQQRVSPTLTKEGSLTEMSNNEWMAMAAQETEWRTNTPPDRSYSPFSRRDGLPEKNVRFEIPPERSLLNIDQLIAESTNEEEIKELKQQKRLFLNRQAALDARNRKESHDQPDHECTQEQTRHMSVADTLRNKNELRKMGEEITSDRRAGETTYHGYRRKVANALTAFGNYFSNTPHETFDDSEFRSENARQYPEVPEESERNEALPQIKLNWNGNDNDGASSIRGRHSRAASVS